MFNQQIITEIISAYGNRFGSGKFHIYIKYHVEEAIEEQEVLLYAWDTVLKVDEFESDMTTFIPYSKIWEICVVDDREEEEK